MLIKKSLFSPASDTTMTITCDNKCNRVYIDGVRVTPLSNPRRMGNWRKTNQFSLPAGSKLLAIWGISDTDTMGVLISMDDGVVSDESWELTATKVKKWHTSDLCRDDSLWGPATVVGQNGDDPWGPMGDFDANAKWIWADEFGEGQNRTVFIRKWLGTYSLYYRPKILTRKRTSFC